MVSLQMEQPSGLWTWFSGRHLVVLALLASVAIITMAWGFEILGGHKPCALCLQERYAYYFAIPMLALALIFVWSYKIRTAQVALLLVSLAYMANGALGAYHAGFEWGFWAGPTDCSGPVEGLAAFDPSTFIEKLRQTEVIPCDRPSWRFLGISFAGYNALFSLALATIALVAARRLQTQ